MHQGTQGPLTIPTGVYMKTIILCPVCHTVTFFPEGVSAEVDVSHEPSMEEVENAYRMSEAEGRTLQLYPCGKCWARIWRAQGMGGAV